MDNIGQTLKELRLSKNLTQDDICKGQFSRTHLSKIENNKTIPTYVIMSQILEGLDITFDEFNYLKDTSYLSNKQKILHDFFLLSTSNKEELLRIKKMCIAYLKTSNSSIISDVLNICEALIQVSYQSKKIECISKITISSVWNRLEKMDSWGVSDLRLVNTILFYFPLETALSIAERLLKEIERYSKFQEIDPFKVALHVNIATLSILGGSLEVAKYSLEIASEISRKIRRFDLYAYSIARLGLITNNKEIFEKGVKILIAIELPEYIKELSSEKDLLGISW